MSTRDLKCLLIIEIFNLNHRHPKIKRMAIKWCNESFMIKIQKFTMINPNLE